MGQEINEYLISLDQLDNEHIGARVSWCKPGTDEYVNGTLQDFAFTRGEVYLYIWGKDNKMHVETTTNPTHTIWVME